MRKLLTFFFALAVTVGVSVSAFGGSMSLLGAGSSGPSAPAGPSFTLVGTVADNTGGGGNVLTISGNIGTAATNRVVVVAVARANPGAYTGVTVNGVNCTDIGNIGGADIWYVAGASPGSGTQTIAITGGNFEIRGAWTLSGLTSTTPLSSATGSPTAALASVSVGDLVFASNDGLPGAGNFNSSTQTPNDNFSPGTSSSPGNGTMADWVITGAASPFDATATGGFDTIAARWH